MTLQSENPSWLDEAIRYMRWQVHEWARTGALPEERSYDPTLLELGTETCTCHCWGNHPTRPGVCAAASHPGTTLGNGPACLSCYNAAVEDRAGPIGIASQPAPRSTPLNSPLLDHLIRHGTGEQPCRIRLADGIVISVLANPSARCLKHLDTDTYAAVEIKLPAEVSGPESWNRYEDGALGSGQYSWLDVQLLRDFIEQHGGEHREEGPEVDIESEAPLAPAEASARLLALAEVLGVDPADLDAAVHDAAARYASDACNDTGATDVPAAADAAHDEAGRQAADDVNNRGLARQVSYLVAQYGTGAAEGIIRAARAASPTGDR
ncbi:hypothetical protein [Streptomyces mirabilis]|uniref:hypothetical protein n=1 Tax=Streptomyces mirabilis TaxID=68239 RepID=UPI0033E15385